MPAVLQKLMRHSAIQTSMGYYVDLDADDLAADLWRKQEKAVQGTNLGTSEADPKGTESDALDVNSCDNKGCK